MIERDTASLERSLGLAVAVTVFAAAMSVLAFEVALTRAFSVLLRYHFVFLAISLATCGLGVGGLIDHLLHRRFPHWQVSTQLTIRALVTAALYPLVILLLFASPLSAKLTSVWVVSLICIAPFLAAGLLLSRAFARYSAESGRLYFADLVGAAIGSFGIIAVLQMVGAINAALVCGLLAAVGALVMAAQNRSLRLVRAGALARGGIIAVPLVALFMYRFEAIAPPLFWVFLIATVAVVAYALWQRSKLAWTTVWVTVGAYAVAIVASLPSAVAGGSLSAAFVLSMLILGVALVAALGLRGLAGPIVMSGALGLLLLANLHGRYVDLPILPLQDDPLSKPLYRELADPRINAKIVASEWNAFARTDVVAYPNAAGEFDSKDDLYIYTDGEVPTNMIAFDGNLEPLERRFRSFIGFIAFEQFRPRSVMLVGPGGGLDILLGLAVGSEEIYGAELNPSIPRIVRQYGEFTGHVYDYENVSIHVDEGRSFLRRSGRQYDMIYMALTKTATTAASSLALVESYIHTREAFADCLTHLTDDGKIAFVCQEPLILLRTLLTAREALAQIGVPYEQSMSHFAAISAPHGSYLSGPYRHLLIISRSPLDAAQVARFGKHAIAVGFDPAYIPGSYVPVPFDILVDNANMDADEYVDRFNQIWTAGGLNPVNIAPCTDDNPFVVDLVFGIPKQFTNFLIGALALAVVSSMLLVLGATRTGNGKLGWGRLSFAAGYFILLGIGFMLVEIALIQKLVLYLGYPVLSLSTILFALLISGSLGSLFTQRWPVKRLPQVVMVAAAGIVLYGLAFQLLYPAIVDATLAYDIRYRCLFTMALLSPLGFCLGMPFPSGLRTVGTWGEGLVPWMWGINGFTSVVGSVAAMSLAKLWGFSSVQMVGWGLYAAVFLLAAAQWTMPRRRDASRIDV
jgi:hypothetical protein